MCAAKLRLRDEKEPSERGKLQRAHREIPVRKLLKIRLYGARQRVPQIRVLSQCFNYRNRCLNMSAVVVDLSLLVLQFNLFCINILKKRLLLIYRHFGSLLSLARDTFARKLTNDSFRRFVHARKLCGWISLPHPFVEPCSAHCTNCIGMIIPNCHLPRFSHRGETTLSSPARVRMNGACYGTLGRAKLSRD